MSKAVVPVHAEHPLARQESSPFAVLQQEIDRLFDGFSRNFPAFGAAHSGSSLHGRERNR